MVRDSGIRKAAILMVSIETEDAVRIMSELDQETLERITLEIARLENVTADERDHIVEEFYTITMARQYVERGGIEYAEELLSRTLPVEDVKKIIGQVKLSIQATPFAFLRKTPSDALATFLADEHPQTIGLVLAHLLPRQASEVLRALPPNKQLQVTRRIASMEQTSPEIVQEVEASLERRLGGLSGDETEKIGGAGTVAEILNFSDRMTEKAILENLETEDPELVEEIRKLMFVFEDVRLVDSRGMQEVLKEVDNDTLALALKGTTDDMKDKFFAAMSKRAADLVTENMEYMGPVKVSDVERAQQEIVDVVRRLEEAGTISVRKRGSEEEALIE